MLRHDFAREAELAQSLASHDFRGQLGQGNTDCLADERHRARGAGIYLQHIDVFAFDRELHIHQTAHIKLAGHRFRGLGNFRENISR